MPIMQSPLPPHAALHELGGIDQVAGLVQLNHVLFYNGLIANIPAGYVIMDGNNGTTNWLNRFVCAIPDAETEAGTAGGATAKTTAGHKHVSPTAKQQQAGNYSGGITQSALWGEDETQTSITLSGGTGVSYSQASRALMLTKSNTDSIADIRPLYVTGLPIMRLS